MRKGAGGERSEMIAFFLRILFTKIIDWKHNIRKGMSGQIIDTVSMLCLRARVSVMSS